MRILIDGDPIVYRAGFSSQNDWKIIRWWDVVDEDNPETDTQHEEFFAYVKERDAFIEEWALHPDEIEYEIWVDPLSEQFCLQIVKDNLRNIVKAIEGYLAESNQEVESVEVYLSGSSNFRDAVATIPGSYKRDGTPVLGYKANRADKRRPYWYQRIRDYMVEVWDAQIFEGIEADDALAIAQWAEDEYAPKTVIATIDKDLLNVPGWHYNVLKKTDSIVSYQQAKVHFYRQLLTGDKTDNIMGCWKMGDAAAKKLIKHDMLETSMYDVCLLAYYANIKKFPEKHGPYGEWPDLQRPAEASLLENARLLWMLQYTDQLWTPPGEPDGSITEAGLLDGEDW